MSVVGAGGTKVVPDPRSTREKWQQAVRRDISGLEQGGKLEPDHGFAVGLVRSRRDHWFAVSGERALNTRGFGYLDAPM